MPIQTNFEHRNVNTVLLVMVMAGAVDLAAGRDRRAGAWFGLAAALKAFPALLLVYLAWRRSWRALGAGLAVAAASTLLPLIPYGPAGAVDAVRAWLSVGLDQGQWQLAASDQSLRALVLRLGGSPGLAAAVVLLVIAFAAVVVIRRRAEPLAGAGATALVAVLAAPVAWVHYFVLAFPAWLALLARGGRGAGVTPLRRTAVWVAAVATSGWLTMGQGPLRRALHAANLYTWGALLLVLLLLATQPPDRDPETG